MPFNDYVKSKASQEQKGGSWYRGTLHFGIELHRLLQECDNETLEYPAFSEASKIDWKCLCSEMNKMKLEQK